MPSRFTWRNFGIASWPSSCSAHCVTEPGQRRIIEQRNHYAHQPFDSLAVVRTRDAGYTRHIVCEDLLLDWDRSATASRVRSAPVSGRRVHLDARILGVR